MRSIVSSFSNTCSQKLSSASTEAADAIFRVGNRYLTHVDNLVARRLNRKGRSFEDTVV